MKTVGVTLYNIKTDNTFGISRNILHTVNMTFEGGIYIVSSENMLLPPELKLSPTFRTFYDYALLALKHKGFIVPKVSKSFSKKCSKKCSSKRCSKKSSKKHSNKNICSKKCSNHHNRLLRVL